MYICTSVSTHLYLNIYRDHGNKRGCMLRAQLLVLQVW